MPYIPFPHVEKTIKIIRESHVDLYALYMYGKCVRFALLLHHLYPGGVVLYDGNHAIYSYDGYDYDISGRGAKRTEGHRPLAEHDLIELLELLH